MKTPFSLGCLPAYTLALLTATLAPTAKARVLDDFNAAQRSGWEDSNPINLPVKGGQQADGKFTFSLPALGQAYFVASKKTTETFELKEGRTIEFRVDLLSGMGPDSFAVVGFIPQATGPNTLAGYGLSKSESDILITKGINKYFYNEDPTPPVKNQNVTLVLNLAVRSGNVHITGQILDKEDGNRVLWEKSFVDTTAADVMSDGKDDPPAPFVNFPGNFVLYLYADGGKDPAGYQVVYDNAEVLVTDTTVLDDFNAAQRSGWEDANPINLPLPGGQQGNGQFTFNLPAVGQAYFIASKKTTRTFELAEGTRHEFSADMVSGQGPDSFSVLAWIPTATGPNTLAGYGIAKSESDILITKGINKYFFDENPNPAIKNQNVRLSLSLTVQGGSVVIRGRVLDRDDGDKVLFDKTFIDTAAADVLADGKDDPAAPFITTGNAVLYLYADGGKDPAGYQVVYDNLAVAAPPAAGNEAPIVTEVSPGAGANFLPASTILTFKVSDDKNVPDAGVAVVLNGTTYTTANGLTLSAAGPVRTASLGGFVAETSYEGEIRATDSDNVVSRVVVFFDTFTTANRVVEVEDYNFDGGTFFNNPVRSPEGNGADNSYTDRAGVSGIDFRETRTAPNGNDTMYRTQDPVRMQRSLDRQRASFSPESSIYDYDVGDLAADEWLHYTRDFAAGTYEIYLREAVVNVTRGDSVLERVTGNPAQENPATEPLGSFLGTGSGFTFRNVPLTDGTGSSKIRLRLSGLTTLRLRTVTPDNDNGGRYLNYLLFVPVPDAGVQRATVSSASPAPNSSVETVTPTIEVAIQNRDTSVKVDTVKLKLNGADIPGATVTATPTGATLSYAISPLPASGAVNDAVVSFKDNEGQDLGSDWQFVVKYNSLDPAARISGTGRQSGFKLHVVQAPQEGGALENSLDRAESQLAANSPIPRVVDINVVENVINFNKRAGETAGNFDGDVTVPGIDPSNTGNGDNDFAVEILTYLELGAGVHRFGVVTDDGYKIASAKTPVTAATPTLAFHNGGPANETFDFVVAQAGIYAFRMVWYERGGAGHGEWFSVNTATGDRALIGGTGAGAVKAWAEVEASAEVFAESSATVTGGWIIDQGAVVNSAAKTVTVSIGAGNRFFRLRAGSALTIVKTQTQGGNLVLTWQ